MDFLKIIEKFVEKEVIYSSTIKIDESASKIIDTIFKQKMCF